MHCISAESSELPAPGIVHLSSREIFLSLSLLCLTFRWSFTYARVIISALHKHPRLQLMLLSPCCQVGSISIDVCYPALSIQHKKLLFGVHYWLVYFSISHFQNHQMVSGGIEISVAKSLSGAISYSE